MRYIVAVVLFGLLAGVFSGCDSKNVAPRLNFKPSITAATFVEATGILTVTVSDADNDTVTVTVTQPTGLIADATSRTVTGGNGSATFHWTAVNAVAGGAGSTVISADDGLTAEPRTRTVALTVPGAPAGPLTITATNAVDDGAGHSQLTVTIAHADNATSSVSVTVPAGMTVDQQMLFVNNGNGNAVFKFTAIDMVAGASGTATITADDGNLNLASATQAIAIAAVPLPAGPVIGAAAWTDNNDGTGALSVPVSRATAADVTVSLSAITGATFDQTSKIVSGGTGTATFTLTEDTAGAGAAGTVTITASDGAASDTASLAVALEHHTVVPPPAVQADTLYAYPVKAEASVDEPVTVVVYSGATVHPLTFMSSVGITVENAGNYVANSFNIGAPGGARSDTDGFWALLGPPAPNNGQYLDLGDALMPGPATDIGGGLHRYNFAIVTQGPFAPPAGALSGNGLILFNFQLTFSAPGTYHLGFQLSDGAFDQTYYNDWNTDTYFWGTLDNTYTVTVN
jgi:hypothetical protein